MVVPLPTQRSAGVPPALRCVVSAHQHGNVWIPGSTYVPSFRTASCAGDLVLLINANACKECMVEIDGATAYACTTRPEARDMMLKPLPNKTLVRDLVTEIAPSGERLMK